MRTTIVRVLADLASLNTHPPFDCGLRSISMTRSTMSWQGQAEQPMMLRGLSVSSLAAKAHCGQQKASTALERPHRHAAVPTKQHAAQLRRGARAHRPQLPSCKPHSARHPRPRLRPLSVGNRGRHAPTAQYHRLLGLALQAHRRPCHGNRSETAGEGRVRVQRGQLVQTIHDSRPHLAQPRAA